MITKIQFLGPGMTVLDMLQEQASIISDGVFPGKGTLLLIMD